MQPLPGFRDTYPADAAKRSVVINAWRTTALSHGFDEYDAPTLEPIDLYTRKNAGGEEILSQLYHFKDQAGRHIALRPEMTPSLARIVAAKEKNFRKPIKWFSIANFFRHERQQRGRLREFLQFNCDIIGDPSPNADAELIALAINSLRHLGLTHQHFVVRLSHRGAWSRFLTEKKIPQALIPSILQIADKLERESPEKIALQLQNYGLSPDDLHHFIQSPPPPELHPILQNLEARGLSHFIQPDLSIVRGLAYYTGPVFEIFDRQNNLRAVAGGGRYDHLIALLSNNSSTLPATGFAMGDVVLSLLLESIPSTAAQLKSKTESLLAKDVFLILADPTMLTHAFQFLQSLRDAGIRADISSDPHQRVNKQFQAAEAALARYAAVLGSEWPSLSVKKLATRQEFQIPKDQLADWLKLHQLP